MRIETDGVYIPGNEDWVIGLLYLTAQEIIKIGLVANSYNGGDYDWISFPKREDGPKDYLVAAYGGLASEISNNKTKSTQTELAYYTLPEVLGDRDDNFTDYLPKKLMSELRGDTSSAADKIYDEKAEKEWEEENWK